VKKSILAVLVTFEGTTVAWGDGSRLRVKRFVVTGRSQLLTHIAQVIPASQVSHLTGIVVAKDRLSFSATRTLLTITNTLAFTAQCPIVLVQRKDQQVDLPVVLQDGERALRKAPQKFLTPHYDAPPNISTPSRGTKFHENAGGIVYDPAKRALLLVQRKDNLRIGTPKGHREAGESLLAAAKREITEETGVADLDFMARLPSVQYLADDHGKLPKKIPHRLHHFLFQRASTRTVPRVMTGETANLKLLWIPVGATKPLQHLHKDLRAVLASARAILIARRIVKLQKRSR
jgi:8-oxo-dGTP pyrophosphatase MutT (NUDIX family)